MADRYGRMGIARTYALVFGAAYVGVALLELILGGGGLRIGGEQILERTPLHNVIHWGTGVALLGSLLASEAVTRNLSRVIGIVFTLVTILGFVARDLTGELLGYGGPLPWSYNLVHLATAVFALVAGFASERGYRTREVAA